jgi:FMN phosphatase YigB (HAD superfamily)
MSTLRSFDIFDTVLTRTLGSPDQVFLEAGRRLRAAGVLNMDPAAYAAARVEAMRDLSVDVARHPTLQAITTAVAARLGLAPAAANDLAAVEIAVERDTCRAVPGAAARLADCRQETGRGVVFVSDTPLPAAVVQELLVRDGLFLNEDRLFVSAEVGSSKQDGGLYDVVAAQLAVAAGEITHVGDDRQSDVANARLHGWRSRLDTSAHLNAHEWALDAAGSATDGLGPRLAGASRLGRLAATQEGIDSGLAAIASAVALPLLTGFGLWVLRQAELLELDRLYFVARDGEVFLDVVQSLARQRGSRVELHYLHGSRRAWQLAAGWAMGQHSPWIPDDLDPRTLSPQDLLALIGVTASEAHAATADPLFAPTAVGQVLGDAGWLHVQSLLASGPLAERVAQHTAQRGELLLGYLDQEGVTAPGRVGLVDVGWTGRAARALDDVVTAGGRTQPAAHLFMGLLGSAAQVMGEELYARAHGWLLDVGRGQRDRTGPGQDPVMLIESFAMGREGHTTGYAGDGDRVVPQLAAPRNEAAARWAFEGYRRALMLALDVLVDGPPLSTEVDLRALAWRQLLRLWNTPSTAEARAWGAQPYGEDFGNVRTHPLATPMTGQRMLAHLGLRKSAAPEPTYWLEGTIALSPQPWRAGLLARAAAQRAGSRLPRVPRRLRAEWALRRG